MAQRSYSRTPRQMRPVKLTPRFTNAPLGSVLCEFGETRVMCTVSVEENVPGWMHGQRGQGGWLTAEYSLLPGSTPDRTRREKNNSSGRTQEIQRLIGRSLRSIIDLRQIGERTLTVDCDVLQADGGTRTASITGAYVALKLAIDQLLKAGKLRANPMKDSIAAVSVGVVDGEVCVDLDYKEDLRADVDLTVVMTGSGQLIEVQGTAEKRPFTREVLNQMLDSAAGVLTDLQTEQMAACD